jgi:hypothetical protein
VQQFYEAFKVWRGPHVQRPKLGWVSGVDKTAIANGHRCMGCDPEQATARTSSTVSSDPGSSIAETEGTLLPSRLTP